MYYRRKILCQEFELLFFLQKMPNLQGWNGRYGGYAQGFPQGLWKKLWVMLEYCRFILTSGVVCFTIDKEYWVFARLSHRRYFG